MTWSMTQLIASACLACSLPAHECFFNGCTTNDFKKIVNLTASLGNYILFDLIAFLESGLNVVQDGILT